jgi:hypothetical protein
MSNDRRTRMTDRHNRITQKPSAADMLNRQLAATQRKPENLDDDFAKAVSRRLESRGIAKVPGLPWDEPEETWADRAIEYGRRTQELEEYWEAQRQAAQEGQNAPQTTADLIRQTMAETYQPTSRADIPLNGPGVIAAAGGNPHASNSFARDSVASLIRQGLMTGSVQDGRNE